MDLNVLIFVIIVVAAGLLAFAVTMYVVALFRQKGQSLSGGAPAAKKKGGMPDDEHKGAGAILRAVRRFASSDDYAVIAPVNVQGTKDAAELMLMIFPPSFMWGRAARVQLTTPMRLTATMRSRAAESMSSTAPDWP